jgi:nitroreductase
VSEKSPEEIEKLKHAPAVEGIPSLLLQRWSPRAFADREIPAADLKKLFVAASWAASSSNEQPWRFLLGRRGDETYKKIFDSLVEFNQMWSKTAPVLLLSVGKKTFTEKGNPNAYALHDTGAATAYLGLAATALGLHTHSMAGFDQELARASFGISSDYEIGAVTAVGYFGDPSILPEKIQKMETAPRSRKPVAEFVFSEWERAATF